MSYLKKFFSKIYLLTPRGVFICFGNCIGVFWFDVLRIRRRLVLDNIRKCFPERTEDEVIQIGRQSLKTLGVSIVDVMCLPFVTKEWVKKNCHIIGKEHIDFALQKEKGVFFLGSHLGSGDIGIASLNYYELKMNLITKRIKTEWINNYWFSTRQSHGTKLIDDRRSTFDILKALKKKEIVVFVLDQFMGPPLGVKTTFFGRETGTAMGLALLVERTKTPVVPSYTYLDRSGKIITVFEEEIPLQDFGSREESIREMTQIYTYKIEEIVRQYPHQWMWVHRRWKEFRE